MNGRLDDYNSRAKNLPDCMTDRTNDALDQAQRDFLGVRTLSPNLRPHKIRRRHQFPHTFSKYETWHVMLFRDWLQHDFVIKHGEKRRTNFVHLGPSHNALVCERPHFLPPSVLSFRPIIQGLSAIKKQLMNHSTILMTEDRAIQEGRGVSPRTEQISPIQELPMCPTNNIYL